MSKRSYTRRTDDERIADLESKLTKIKSRVADKKQRESPIHRDMKKVQRVLRTFAQTALNHEREDLANSTTAFLAGLERIAAEKPAELSRRASRNNDHHGNNH